MSALTWQYMPKNKIPREDHVLSKPKSPAMRFDAIQAKLTIGQPGDIYEQEADRLADRVMRMTDESLVQRQAGCPGCEEEEELVQAKSASLQTPQVTPALESGISSLKGGGQPLSESTRSFFEPRFGTDFSHVRVHTDDRAAQTARSINAKAYTTGKDIVFNQGQYSPETLPGKRLLAHELTHVIQQKPDDIYKKKSELQIMREENEATDEKSPNRPLQGGAKIAIETLKKITEKLTPKEKFLTRSDGVAEPDYYYSTKSAAVEKAREKAYPAECFILRDGTEEYPWRPNKGFGCAHYVAHELNMKGSRGCFKKYLTIIDDIKKNSKEIKKKDVKINDIWISKSGKHSGKVVSVPPKGKKKGYKARQCNTEGRVYDIPVDYNGTFRRKKG